MELYIGEAQDRTNYKSEAYLKVNSCGSQSNGGRAFATLRSAGRVDYHILYIVKGICRADYQGKTQTLTEGDFIVYLPHQRQCYSFSAGTETKTWWLHFSGKDAEEVLFSLGLNGGIFRGEPDILIQQGFERLAGMGGASPSEEAIANGMLLMLLGFLAGQSGFGGPAPSVEAVAPAMRLMREELARQITVRECAALCRMSESRFQHVFREATGTSPHRFLLNLRMETARELLLHTNLRISDIAAMSGFEDPLYFTRAFRKETGCAPRQWRKGIRGKTG